MPARPAIDPRRTLTIFTPAGCSATETLAGIVSDLSARASRSRIAFALFFKQHLFYSGVSGFVGHDNGCEITRGGVLPGDCEGERF